MLENIEEALDAAKILQVLPHDFSNLKSLQHEEWASDELDLRAAVEEERGGTKS